jgi:alkanesulfonate monooxygenase SsuD/methylene tetrahydromethanopterin reductase-like flavin-dependent oxidoreductase (luciferase family)
MKVGLIQDGAAAGRDVSSVQRMEELVAEAVLADEMGFDFYGLAEVHFSPEMTVSSPEVVLGYIAARTRQMRLRFVSMPLLAFNHPVRVAERIATLDILSGGRIELGCGRSNQAHTLEAFEIPVETTREQFVESLDIIVDALTNETFSYDGEHFRVPERSLFPRPAQLPHPPVHVAATSLETHRFAGERGYGVMSGNSLTGGWDFVQECIDLYRDSWRDPSAEGRAPNSMFATLALRANCAETNEQAQAEAADAAFEAIDLVMRWYSKIAEQSSDYSYMARFSELDDHRRDLPWMIERAPYLTIGDPDFFVDRIRRLEEMGVDELLLEIDGIDHATHMRAIELIGTEVLPRVRATEPAGSA